LPPSVFFVFRAGSTGHGHLGDLPSPSHSQVQRPFGLFIRREVREITCTLPICARSVMSASVIPPKFHTIDKAAHTSWTHQAR